MSDNYVRIGAPEEKSLKTLPKTVSDGADVRCAGRLFQRLAAETGKATCRQ